MQPTVVNAFSIAADRHANGRALPRKVRNALALVRPGDTLPLGIEVAGFLGDDATSAAAYLLTCDDRRAELTAEILRLARSGRAPDGGERQRIGARLSAAIGRPDPAIIEALGLPEGANWQHVSEALVRRWNTPVTVPGAPRLRRAHAEF